MSQRCGDGLSGAEKIHGGSNEDWGLASVEGRVIALDIGQRIPVRGLGGDKNGAGSVGYGQIHQAHVSSGNGLEAGRIGEAFHGMHQTQPVLLQFQSVGLQLGLLQAQVMNAKVEPNGAGTGQDREGHDKDTV
jgi:hypothetical protein